VPQIIWPLYPKRVIPHAEKAGDRDCTPSVLVRPECAKEFVLLAGTAEAAPGPVAAEAAVVPSDPRSATAKPRVPSTRHGRPPVVFQNFTADPFFVLHDVTLPGISR
jgi:hypothetical protein